MAQRGIREFDAKRMIAQFLPNFTSVLNYSGRVALVAPTTRPRQFKADNPWIETTQLVVKPDQLFGKRGKHNLILLDAQLSVAQEWVQARMNKEVVVSGIKGTLTHFLVEPFIPHDRENYVSIRSHREGDTICFSVAGGIHIEENWDQVSLIQVPVLSDIDSINLEMLVPKELGHLQKIVIDFIKGLYKFYRELGFTYLEINPFNLSAEGVTPLDVVARLDDTAAFECSKYWGEIEFPSPFGRTPTSEEKYITELDEKTGASLKLTVLNPEGRIWLMVAGGGASVIYTDTVVDLGHVKELANYGEYSGDPSMEETREYARTILDLMTRKADPGGKCLLIGGGIANFTDVAKTFTGIIAALREYQKKILDHNIKIFVRRGGPNYQEGLENMRALGGELGIPIEVFGPDTHMTKIVPMAMRSLGL
ncbi:MAG: ATPase [Beggiatoa sp. IS2]|nr:MAG: ATPase [Beggiatoa sp. IS2]